MRTWPVLPLILVASLAAQQPAEDLLPAVIAQHAAHNHRLHAQVASLAAEMQTAITEFLAKPDASGMQRAKDAWCRARSVYGRLEALRFHGGPIDAVEPLLNAWPVDESYIDYVIENPASGIILEEKKFPVISGPLLEHLNERGSETNVSVGWHAIEFLLWGQDLDPAGPGQRPLSDYVSDGTIVKERRRPYLRLVTSLLVGHLRDLERAWAPGAENFRRRFEANPRDALRRMLTGTMILTAFELTGERLAVAYETQDQEQEHSCFSDTTCADLVANQLGIMAVFQGGEAILPEIPSLLGLLRQRDPAIAENLVDSLGKTLVALQAIPHPFDQAFLGADDAPGRQAIAAALTALEQQAEAIAIAGKLLGFDLPVRPGN